MSDVKDVPQVVVENVLFQKVAALAVTGAKKGDICTALNITRYELKKILDNPKFHELVEKAGEEELTPALTRAKSQLAKLVDKSIKVIERNLDEGSLEAARLVFRAVGLEKADTQAESSAITVILPGADQPRTIDAEGHTLQVDTGTVIKSK